MKVKPTSITDTVKINITLVLNALYKRTKLPLFRMFGDILIKWAKTSVDDVIYVLVDLSSLYIVNPKYERKIAMYLASVPSGAVFIDVGAHIGKYALSLAKKGAKVIAIEPNPIAFRALMLGIELNGFKNITALNLALSDHDGVAKLYLRRSSVASTIVNQNYAYAAKNIPVKNLTP